MDTTKSLFEAVLIRFGKAFVSGALTGASVITISNIHNWTDLQTALQSLSMCMVIGGINGVILAVEKWYNWTPTTL